MASTDCPTTIAETTDTQESAQPEPTYDQGMRLWSWGASLSDWTMQPNGTIRFHRDHGPYPMRAQIRPDGTYERLG